jgi:hypothetical protein
MTPDKEKHILEIATLRQLIQSEIDYAFQIENEYRFSHETREANDRKWKEFTDKFFPGEEDV